MDILKDKPSYYLGIDGGGTKTAFLLTDPEGKTVSSVILGPSNPFDIGKDEALRVLGEGIRSAVGEYNPRDIAAYAGIAGGSSGENRKIIGDFLSSFGFYAAGNGSDGDNAVSAALGADDGICVIAGTGSVAFYQENGSIGFLGGLGYLFDREGSGYDIGALGIRAAIMGEQGIEPGTSLTEMFLNRFGTRTVRENLNAFYAGGKKYIASFAPDVIGAAEAGDTVAQCIIRDNMQYIARLIYACADKMNKNGKIRVRLCGGIFTGNDMLPYLLPYLKSGRFDTSVCTEENVMGAVKLARRLENG